MIHLASAMCHSLPLADHGSCAPDWHPWLDPVAWQISEAGAVALAHELLRRAGDPGGALRLATEAGRVAGVEQGWRMCLEAMREGGEQRAACRGGLVR